MEGEKRPFKENQQINQKKNHKEKIVVEKILEKQRLQTKMLDNIILQQNRLTSNLESLNAELAQAVLKTKKKN